MVCCLSDTFLSALVGSHRGQVLLIMSTPAIRLELFGSIHMCWGSIQTELELRLSFKIQIFHFIMIHLKLFPFLIGYVSLLGA